MVDDGWIQCPWEEEVVKGQSGRPKKRASYCMCRYLTM